MAIETGRSDPETPKLIEICDGVHVRQEIDNIGWVDLGDRVLVVDALEVAALEDEVFKMIADTTGDKPVKHVLNTHTHYDHVALNEAFRTRHGAEIINQVTPGVPAEGVWFEGGGRRVQMLPMPDCHTSEDCIVWLPDDRVLFVGDIFGWGLIPWDRPLTTEKRDHLVGTYERLLAFDAQVVVPGHGPLCSNVELQRWLVYLEWATEEVRAAITTKKRKEIDANVIPPPQDMHNWWRFVQWKHSDTLKKISHAFDRGRLE